MPETIGQQLKQARLERGVSLEEVTKATRIQSRFLEAMEADEFESLPAPVQARAFLRIYAEYLNLSIEDVIARQRDSLEPAINSLQSAETSDVQTEEFVEEDGDHEDDIVQPATGENGGAGEPVLEESSARPDPNEDLSESGGIFRQIGKELADRRSALSLTVEEVEEHTHVRSHYLQDMESGNFDRLPSSVQTRGMLNNYAHFLDMDVDAMLLHYADGLQAQRREKQSPSDGRTQTPKRQRLAGIQLPTSIRNYLTMDVLVGSGLVIILLGFAIWGTSRIIGIRAAVTPEVTAPSISDMLAASALFSTPTPPLSNSSETIPAPPTAASTLSVTLPAAGQGPVQIVLVALEQAFVRVTVDGKVSFDGRVVAGTAYPYDGNSQIEVLTGDGAAISILYNKADMGAMGTFGEVVDRIYTANAILAPTATFTPTPTKTPLPSATPRMTATPRPTSPPSPPKSSGEEH